MADDQCWCRACERKTAATAMGRGDFFGALPRFIVCPICGDKRCLHAADHSAPCAKADLYAHNAWVERMALRSQPRDRRDTTTCDPAAVIALGAWGLPTAGYATEGREVLTRSAGSPQAPGWVGDE